MITWETKPLDTGNLFRWSVLIGNINDRRILETFNEDSYFNLSLMKAKRKIKRKFKILEHGKNN